MAGNQLQLNEAQLRALLTGSNGPVVRHVTDIVRRANNLAKIECPVDTGNLRARHQYAVTVSGTNVIGRFGSDAKYAAAVHNGRQTTTSVRAGSSTIRTTRRIPGNPWLIRAATRAGISVTRTGTFTV